MSAYQLASTSLISGSCPTVPERRTRGALSVRTVDREVRTAYTTSDIVSHSH